MVWTLDRRCCEVLGLEEGAGEAAVCWWACVGESEKGIWVVSGFRGG